MGSYQNQYYNNYFNKFSLSQTSVKNTNLSEIPSTPKTIKMNILNDDLKDISSFQNESSNNISAGLTPFSPADINDEIYPNEQFIFKEKSTGQINSQNTESNSGYLLNNNIIYNSNVSKDISKNNNDNLVINNVYSFYYQNSYKNINELSNFKYINNKLMQIKLEKILTDNTLLRNKSKEEQPFIMNNIKIKDSFSDFDFRDNKENKEKINNNHLNSNEKKIKNILKLSPKRINDLKINKKVDFKRFSKEEEINEKYNNHINLDSAQTYKAGNFNSKKIRNYKHKPSYDIKKIGKNKLLDIVNNNMQQNIYMNGGGLISGNNFVEDFLQNELKRNKTENINPI